MKWEKRLKWLRISKIVIPIALAVSLVFAGITVYGTEAQNFVIRTKGGDEVSLALSMNQDLSEQTSRLLVPVAGESTNCTLLYDDEQLNYSDEDEYYIPGDIREYNNLAKDNEIARKYGVNCGYDREGLITYVSISFFLINNSERAVDVDMVMNLDGIVTNGNVDGDHVDDVLRIMVIEGEPLLSDRTYTVYSKAEETEENQQHLNKFAPYSQNTVDFESESVIFSRTGENGITDLGAGESVKFTIVLWLEGFDVSCTSEIYGEMAKMSIDFYGY